MSHGLSVVADLTKGDAEMQRAVKETIDAFGGLDIIVNRYAWTLSLRIAGMGTLQCLSQIADQVLTGTMAQLQKCGDLSKEDLPSRSALEAFPSAQVILAQNPIMYHDIPSTLRPCHDLQPSWQHESTEPFHKHEDFLRGHVHVQWRCDDRGDVRQDRGRLPVRHQAACDRQPSSHPRR